MPAVSLASIEFKEAAQVQADALGMADARCVFVAHPIQDATDAEMQQKADAIVEEVVTALSIN